MLAEDLIPSVGAIEVLRNRTGLVMLPAQEPVKGASYYLGEALISEAQVRLATAEGYGACLGRDREHALAIAIIDAARAADVAAARIDAFLARQAAALAQADQELLAQVEETRVEMETF